MTPQVTKPHSHYTRLAELAAGGFIARGIHDAIIEKQRNADQAVSEQIFGAAPAIYEIIVSGFTGARLYQQICAAGRGVSLREIARGISWAFTDFECDRLALKSEIEVAEELILEQAAQIAALQAQLDELTMERAA